MYTYTKSLHCICTLNVYNFIMYVNYISIGQEKNIINPDVPTTHRGGWGALGGERCPEPEVPSQLTHLHTPHAHTHHMHTHTTYTHTQTHTPHMCTYHMHTHTPPRLHFWPPLGCGPNFSGEPQAAVLPLSRPNPSSFLLSTF